MLSPFRVKNQSLSHLCLVTAKKLNSKHQKQIFELVGDITVVTLMFYIQSMVNALSAAPFRDCHSWSSASIESSSVTPTLCTPSFVWSMNLLCGLLLFLPCLTSFVSHTLNLIGPSDVLLSEPVHSGQPQSKSEHLHLCHLYLSLLFFFVIVSIS